MLYLGPCIGPMSFYTRTRTNAFTVCILFLAIVCIEQVFVGRIIGRGGNAIRQLSHSTGAKIIVEREEDRFISSSNYPGNACIS